MFLLLPITALHDAASLATNTSCNSMSKKTKSKRRVSLYTDVAVVPIPTRTEYPDLIRERIWSSASELCQNAARNTIEFAAEGFDWRNAAEDEQMVKSPSGERIHPIHYLTLGINGAQITREAEVTPVSMDAEPLHSEG